MNEVDPAIYVGVQALLAEFAWRVDQGQGSRVADLFVEAGTISTAAFSLPDRATIHAWFSERAIPGGRISRHNATSIRVTPLGEGRFEVTANAFTVVNPGGEKPGKGAAVAIGTSTDVVVQTADGLRFESRSLETLIEGQIQAGAGH